MTNYIQLLDNHADRLFKPFPSEPAKVAYQALGELDVVQQLMVETGRPISQAQEAEFNQLCIQLGIQKLPEMSDGLLEIISNYFKVFSPTTFFTSYLSLHGFNRSMKSPNNARMTLGDEIARIHDNGTTRDTLYYVVTRNFDFADGQFNEGKESCWWQNGRHGRSRINLSMMHGMCIKLYSLADSSTPTSRVYSVDDASGKTYRLTPRGRAWIAPTRDGLVLFNFYDTGIKKAKHMSLAASIASHMSSTSGKEYQVKYSSLREYRDSDNSTFINGDAGYFVQESVESTDTDCLSQHSASLYDYRTGGKMSGIMYGDVGVWIKYGGVVESSTWFNVVKDESISSPIYIPKKYYRLLLDIRNLIAKNPPKGATVKAIDIAATEVMLNGESPSAKVSPLSIREIREHLKDPNANLDELFVKKYKAFASRISSQKAIEEALLNWVESIYGVYRVYPHMFNHIIEEELEPVVQELVKIEVQKKTRKKKTSPSI